MELLSPAGNVEKLYYAYAYGADAAYIGLKKFSLRVKADNFYGCEYKNVCALKDAFPGKKLFCALNISFHNRDIDAFIADIDYFKQYPIDAFIVQDMGIVPILQKYFPDTALHLSTQANCINREAVKLYHSMGFKRIVLGREASLAEIREIKDAVPDIELEVFVHGAMCIAYSGRCLMSAYMNGRSANGGFCSHSCRWDYILKADAGTLKNLAESGALVLEERKRPGEYLPVFEGDDFTAVLSSKDLCMIDHLADMRAAGVDSLKIEGRMKSVYYVALVTRAYRKALDALDGTISQRDADPFIAELDKVSHRAFGTGFYYGQSDANETVKGASESEYELAAKIGAELTENEIQQVYATPDTGLAEDVGNMVVHRIDAYIELAPDLLICQPCFYEFYDFELPISNVELLNDLILESVLLISNLLILLLRPLFLVHDCDEKEYEKHYEIEKRYKRQHHRRNHREDECQYEKTQYKR